LAVAKATKASFIREVVTGAGQTAASGIRRPERPLRYRRSIGAEHVRILTNISAEFAAPLAHRPIEVVARGVSMISLVDGLCVSGAMTGDGADQNELQRVREAIPGTVLFANTGVAESTVAETLSVVDGVIVGTSVKMDRITWNAVDSARAAAFMEVVRSARSEAELPHAPSSAEA
jgi:membrane complex biogenesis BtpA family protein